VTRLWTNDLDTLADGLAPDLVYASTRRRIAERLIDQRVVRVLDPDDTELVERTARKLGWSAMTVRAFIVALRKS
jgi:hypothetical protein